VARSTLRRNHYLMWRRMSTPMTPTRTSGQLGISRAAYPTINAPPVALALLLAQREEPTAMLHRRRWAWTMMGLRQSLPMTLPRRLLRQPPLQVPLRERIRHNDVRGESEAPWARHRSYIAGDSGSTSRKDTPQRADTPQRSPQARI